MAHERAGQIARPEDLIDIASLVTAYYTRDVDPHNPDQQVVFGTSGHRGSSLDNAFNEVHILATTQAIVDYRREQNIGGPVFIGRDTHALSEPAMVSALEVLFGNGLRCLLTPLGVTHRLRRCRTQSCRTTRSFLAGSRVLIRSARTAL